MKKSNKVEVFEVYFCYYKDEVVYIGKGSLGRHKHCNSGASHVYKMNEIHFKEGSDVLKTEVVKYFKTNKEAIEFEKASILKFKPKFNTVFTDNNNRGKSAKASCKIRSNMKKFPIDKAPKYGKFNYRDYEELVDEFVDHFGYKFTSGDFKIYGYDFYKNIGADKLRALSRFIRNGHHKLSKLNHKMVFYDCVKELYGIELEDCLSTKVEV